MDEDKRDWKKGETSKSYMYGFECDILEDFEKCYLETMSLDNLEPIKFEDLKMTKEEEIAMMEHYNELEQIEMDCDSLMNEMIEDGWSEDDDEDDDCCESDFDDSPMSVSEFAMFTNSLLQNGEVGSIPFWETPEFEESNMQIIDGKIELIGGSMVKGEFADQGTQFFYDFLKPLVDSYIAKVNDARQEKAVDEASETSYQRAMSLLK